MHRLFPFAAALCLAIPAQAAMLRPYTEISGETVRLADLFDRLGDTPDRVLGKGPAPGARISVGAAQLAAIARDFGVDWRPATGNEQAVVERRADAVPQSAISEAIRKALISKGAPETADIAMPDAQPFLIPSEYRVSPEISQTSYDPATGRFTTMVSIRIPDAPPLQQRVSGIVVPMERTVVTTRRLAHGATIAEGDLHSERVRQERLHGSAPLSEEAALGLTVKHDIAAGQALTLADLSRPELIARGSLVHMQLTAEGIVLTGQGIARESGAMGDRIRVENPASHAIIQAEITGAGEVRVDPNRVPLTLAAAR